MNRNKMKRDFLLILALLLSMVTFAQLNGNGYYRVKNNGTGTYIWVCDNTGSINVATTSADMGAIQLWKGLDKAIPEAESVLYFENKGGNSWNISAMGTSIYDIINYNVELSSATKNGVTLYEVSATKAGQTLYLYDGGSSGADFNGLKTSGTLANRKWLIEPITTNGDNYFGIKPTITVGNKYYEPLYVSFPFSFASSGMKAYYICKVDGNIAVIKELKSDVIPAKTPVIIECSSNNPANNRVNLLTSSSTTVNDNVLKGNFFANEFRPDSRNASVIFNASSMRVWNKGSNGKLTLNTDKSTLHESWFGDGMIYLNATSSYLSVANGTATEMTIMTEEEYANREILITGITLNQTSATLKIGESLQLAATVNPSNATNKKLTWTSSNSTVASVDANGKVNALAVGTATITVSSNDGTGIKATCKVEVKPIMVSGLTINTTSAEVFIGESLQLNATISPSNATNKAVEWKSSNTAIATVDANGLVTTKAVGDVTISVTTKDGSNLKAECAIKVKPILVQSISISQTTAELKERTTIQLTASVGPSNATNPSVTWTSSDNSIATVSANGLLTGVAVGSAEIKVAANDGSGIFATCQVNVSENPILVENITISQTEAELTIKDVLQLSSTINPENATNTSVTWSSSKPEVASVDENGLVTALSDGETIITVTANGGQNVKASCKVVVKPIFVTSLELTPSSADLLDYNELQLTAIFEPVDATYQTVTWQSSDETIATVNTTGLVKMLTPGQVVITATTIDGTNLTATCTINCVDGITEIIANSDEVDYYTVDGKKLQRAQKGLNIVRTADGKTYKLYVK